MQAFKITLVGNENVGKTCLLSCYMYGDFPQQYFTVPSDYLAKAVLVDSKQVGLKLWDSSGKPEYDKLRHIAYQDTDLFLICFSLVSPDSFESVKTKWLLELTQHCQDVPFLLIGTKLDLRDDENMISSIKEKDQTPITNAAGSQLATEIGAAKYLECSALTKEGMNDVFDEAARILLNRLPIQKPKKSCSVF